MAKSNELVMPSFKNAEKLNKKNTTSTKKPSKTTSTNAKKTAKNTSTVKKVPQNEISKMVWGKTKEDIKAPITKDYLNNSILNLNKGPISTEYAMENFGGQIQGAYNRQNRIIGDYSPVYGIKKDRYNQQRAKNPFMPEFGSFEYFKNSIEKITPKIERILSDDDWIYRDRRELAENYAKNPNWTTDPKKLAESKAVYEKYKVWEPIINEYKSLYGQLKEYDVKGVHFDLKGVDTKSGAEEAKRNSEHARRIAELNYHFTNDERAKIAMGEGTDAQNEQWRKFLEPTKTVGLEKDKVTAYEYYEKNKDKEYKDTLPGRSLGNYKIGRTGIKSNDAGYTSYLYQSDDIEAAEVYQLLAQRIQDNNKKTFTNNTGFDRVVSDVFQYAPQGIDQLLASLGGQAVGSMFGVVGRRVGGAAASAAYMYRQSAGGAYVRLLQNSGLSTEDAKRLASSEAQSAALVEFGLEALLSGLWKGAKTGSNAIKGLVKSEATQESAGRLLKSLIKIGMSEDGAKKALLAAKNLGSTMLGAVGEGAEEWIQTGMSLTADKYAKAGKTASTFELFTKSFDLSQYTEEDFKQMNDSFVSSVIIGLGSSSAKSAFSGTMRTAVNKMTRAVDNVSFGALVERQNDAQRIINFAVYEGLRSDNKDVRKAASKAGKKIVSGRELSLGEVGIVVKNAINEGKNVFSSDYEIERDSDVQYDKSEDGVKYSIAEITGDKDNYGIGVYLDTDLFDGIKPRNWGNTLSDFVYNNLAGKELTVYDDSGNPTTIQFAKKNERVLKDGANNSHRVIDKLARTKGNIQTLSIVHIDELLETSQKINEVKDNNHQWLDENGWDHRKTYVQDIKGKIYEATLNIAKASDGRNILYSISNVKEVDAGAVPSNLKGRGSHISSTSKYSISQEEPIVNNNNFQKIKGTAERIFNLQIMLDDRIPVKGKDGKIVEADGYYKDGVIHLSKNAKKPLEFVLSHEITHHLQAKSRDRYNYFKMLALRYEAREQGKSIDEIIKDKQDVYKSVGLTKNQAMDEIAADFASKMLEDGRLENLLQRLEKGEFAEDKSKARVVIQSFIDSVKDIIARIKAKFTGGKYFNKAVELEQVIKAYESAAERAVKSKENNQNGVQYDVEKSFEQQVHEILTGKIDRNHIYVGRTTSILRQLGLNDLPMLITSGHIRDINHEKVEGISKYHGLDEKIIKRLPEILENPAIVFDSISKENPDAVCILSSIVDDELPIMVVIKPDGEGRYNNVRVSSNFILSMYGRDKPQGFLNAIGRNSDNILYINKIKTQEMIKAARLQLPAELNNLKSNVIIHKSKNVVNRNLEKKRDLDGGQALISEENGIESEFESEDIDDLKFTIRLLRSRSEYLKGKKVSSSVIYGIAKDKIKEYNSGISARELAVKISGLYDDVGKYGIGENIEAEAIVRKSREIAREILNQSNGIQQEISPEDRMMRNHIRTTSISISEQDKGDFGSRADWNAFRKANFGRIRISNKGISVDSFYQELASLYPQYFNADKYTHPADQLRHIASVLDDTQAVTIIDGKEFDNEYTELMLATEILEGFSNAEAEAKSVYSEIENIDRASRKDYEAKRVEDRESLREWYKERYKEILEDRKFDRDMLEAEYKDKVKKVRAERRNSEEKKKLLNLLRHFNRLKVTPERLEGIKAKMNEEELETFKDIEEFAGKTPVEIVKMLDDWGVKLLEEGYERTDGVKVMGRLELSELEAQYNQAKEADPDFLPTRILEEKFKRLHGIQIDTLEQAQVRELIELLAGVKTQIENENKMLASEEEKRVDEVVKKIHKELKDGKKFMDKMGFGGVTDKVDIFKNFKKWQRNANTIFKTMAGYLPDSEFDKLAEELREGQKKQASFERAAEKHFSKFFEDHPEMKRTPKTDSKEKWISIGDGLSISPGMRIALYLHSKNNSNMESIKDFGVTIPKESVYKKGKKKDSYNQGRTIKLSPSDVKEIVKGMTTEEREFADNFAYTFFNGVTTEHINEVSRRLIGYDVAVVKHYFPKNTDMNMVQSENIGVYDVLGTAEGQGFLKHRTGGKPVLLLDVNDVIDRTIKGTAKYYGYAEAMRDVRKVLGRSADGGKTTLGLISELHGEDMKNWTEDLLRDLENPKVSPQFMKQKARGLKGRFANYVLTLRITTMLKQAGAYFVGIPEVGMKNWVLGKGRRVYEQDIELWRDASTAFWQRGTDLKKIDPRGYLENIDKFWIQRLNSGIQAGLEREFGIKRDVKSSEYWDKVKSPEFKKELGKRIDDMINKTQSVYTVMERPTLLRGDDNILKGLLPFRTQNFQDHNLLTQNIQEFRALKRYEKEGLATKEQVEEAGKKCANTVVGLTLNHIYSAFAMLLGNAILGQKFAKRYEEKGEDEEEEQKMYDELSPFWQGVNKFFNKDEKGVITPESVKDKMISDVLNGFAGEVMFLDTVVGFVENIVEGKQFYDIEIGELGMVNDAITALGDTAVLMKDYGTDDFSNMKLCESLVNLSMSIGAVLGYPLSNIKDILSGFVFATHNNIELANKKFEANAYFNPYFMEYNIQKHFANTKKDKEWFTEKFYQAAKFAVSVKNTENRKTAYRDLAKMFDDMSSKFKDKKERESFQEKLYKEMQRLGERNADIIKRVLEEGSYTHSTIPDKEAIDKEIERLTGITGEKVTFKPSEYGVLTYTVTEENGEQTEKTLSLHPIESVWYAKDVENMIYSAYSDAMGRGDWKYLTDEERVDLLQKYKGEAIGMVTDTYVQNKTGDNVPQTAFEKFAVANELRKDSSKFVEVPGVKYVKYDGVEYALTDEMSKEYGDYKRKLIKDAGEDIFTNGISIEDVIGKRYSTVNGKRVYFTGCIDDYPVELQDKVYDKIDDWASNKADKDFEEQIKQGYRFKHVFEDGKWGTEIKGVSKKEVPKNIETDKEISKEKNTKITTPPVVKTSYNNRGVKSVPKNSYAPVTVKTEEDGTKSVKVGVNYYRRADIKTRQIGTKYQKISKSPYEISKLTQDSWKNVMDTWIKCLTQWKFNEEDSKILQLLTNGMEAVEYQPESVAAAFWEWVEYGEKMGYDTSEYMEGTEE